MRISILKFYLFREITEEKKLCKREKTYDFKIASVKLSEYRLLYGSKSLICFSSQQLPFCLVDGLFISHTIILGMLVSF